MTFNEFHNALRILANIDRHEAGDVFATPEDWWDFMENPWRWFIRASDEQAEAVWRIIEERQSQKANAA